MSRGRLFFRNSPLAVTSTMCGRRNVAEHSELDAMTGDHS